MGDAERAGPAEGRPRNELRGRPHFPSTTGLALGAMLLAFSLTPSLLPRTAASQGILSGLCLAAGYGLGILLSRLWLFLRLPAARGRAALWARVAVLGTAALLALLFFLRSAEWQNEIRRLMGMEPVSSPHMLAVAVIALLTFLLLIGLARLLRRAVRFMIGLAPPWLPPRLAGLLGFAATALLVWAVLTGLVFRAGLHLADSSYRELDALVEPEHAPPSDPSSPGGPGSLLRWDDLGRAGREYVASGPSAEAIGAFLGRPAADPIRVYAGLRSGEGTAERAALAVRELIRVGGFDRAVLVVITPTGTGWVDPAAIDTLEYLHGGDVASVAMQYSYLASPLSLIVEPGYGAQASRALFTEVYRHWSRLPRDRRPRLYLYGLSLGALSSEQSADLIEMVADPIQGALWTGPPFPSPLWRRVTAARNPGSPAWLPRYRDGSLIRFTSQRNMAALPGARWGPVRIVYLQYASDPVTFFDARSLYRRPDWMEAPRGPDLSSGFRWYPIVTFVQLLTDMAVFDSAPRGFGHSYHPAHHIDAWVEVTDVQGWPPAEIERLKQHFAERFPRRVAEHHGQD